MVQEVQSRPIIETHPWSKSCSCKGFMPHKCYINLHKPNRGLQCNTPFLPNLTNMESMWWIKWQVWRNGDAQALVRTMSIFMHLVTLNKDSLFVLSCTNVVKESFPKFYVFRLGEKTCQIFIERSETRVTITMQPKAKNDCHFLYKWIS